jgi:hypothetical protein
MATIRVTTRTHLFAFKSCAIQQTTRIAKAGFYAPGGAAAVKAVASGSQRSTINGHRPGGPPALRGGNG